ncbi:MAG TPA: ABC transporter substrate-binding protein [Nitrososphaeraceae archaeon]|nr:ABC transporter substrate-binding protein [Nitrososphaeraceae archaeon]
MRPRNLYISIILAIAIGDSLIIFSEQEDKLFFANLVLNINSFVAASLAIFVIIKEKNKSNLKANIFLVVGLVLWFIANIVWAYYEVILHLMAPVPSLADVLLLSAYSILIIRLLIEYKSLKKKPTKKFTGVVAVIIAAFLVYIFSLTLDISVLSTARGQLMFAVTVVYPIFNSVLCFMAIIILYGLRKEKEKEEEKNHHDIAWTCELIGFLVIVLGDSWFAIIVLTEFVEQLWISALLLSAHYIMIAGGLLWYIRLANSSNQRGVFRSIKNTLNTKKKTVVTGIILIVILIVSIASYTLTLNYDDVLVSSEPDANYVMSNQNKINEVPIGLISSLTGAWSSGGKSIKIAVEKAEKDVNNYFENKNSSMRTRLLVEDSKTNPVESVHALKRLIDSDVRIVIGPATSAAVMSVKDYANQHDVILISPSSTSAALSIADDNLFRFVPDDRNQAEFISNKMWNDGIRVVIPMWRSDTFGNELVKGVKENFEKKGGLVMEGVEYHPHTGEFSSSLHRINFIMWNQYLKKLSNIVENTTHQFDAQKVGVYLVSFDEVTPILIQSNEHPILQKVKWYGSDASAQNLQIIRNHDAAYFAEMINFSNPLFQVNLSNSKAETLGAEIEKKLHGSSSLTYPILAYDTYWVTALSLEKIIDNRTIDIDVESLKKIITGTAANYEGISGKIILNAAGDRINANYDIWSVVKSQKDFDNYIWKQDIASIYTQSRK